LIAWNSGFIRCLWRVINNRQADKRARVQAYPSTAASPATSKYPAYCKFAQCLFPARCHIISTVSYVKNLCLHCRAFVYLTHCSEACREPRRASLSVRDALDVTAVAARGAMSLKDGGGLLKFSRGFKFFDLR